MLRAAIREAIQTIVWGSPSSDVESTWSSFAEDEYDVFDDVSVALSEEEEEQEAEPGVKWESFAKAQDEQFLVVSPAGECVVVSSNRSCVGGVALTDEIAVNVVRGEKLWHVCTLSDDGWYAKWRSFAAAAVQPDSRYIAFRQTPVGPVISRRVSDEIHRDPLYSRSSCDVFVTGDTIMRTAPDGEGGRVVELTSLVTGEILRKIPLAPSQTRFAGCISGFFVAQIEPDAIVRIDGVRMETVAWGRIVGPIVQSCGGDHLAFVVKGTHAVNETHVVVVGAHGEASAKLPEPGLYVERFYESESAVLLRNPTGGAWIVQFS